MLLQPVIFGDSLSQGHTTTPKNPRWHTKGLTWHRESESPTHVTINSHHMQTRSYQILNWRRFRNKCPMYLCSILIYILFLNNLLSANLCRNLCCKTFIWISICSPFLSFSKNLGNTKIPNPSCLAICTKPKSKKRIMSLATQWTIIKQLTQCPNMYQSSVSRRHLMTFHQPI